MGDNYETLDTYQNVNPPPIPAKSNEQSPLIEVSPLPDPESDLLKSRTDLYSKKFAAEKQQTTMLPKKTMILIYVAIMILSIIAFNIGVAIGYFAL